MRKIKIYFDGNSEIIEYDEDDIAILKASSTVITLSNGKSVYDAGRFRWVFVK